MKLTVLACAALLGLTACGGSGSSGGLNYNGGSNNNSGANNNGSNNNGSNNGGANNGNANNNGGSNIGGGSNLNNGGGSNNNGIAPAPSPSQSYDGVVISGEIDNGGKTPTQTISSNNFDKITVNGIDITLKREGISAGTFTRIT